MNSTFARGLQPQTVKLVLVAGVAVTAGALSVLAFQQTRRKVVRRRLRDEVEDRAHKEEVDGSDEELPDLVQLRNGKPLGGPASGSTSPVQQKGGARTPAGAAKRRKVNHVIVREALARNYVFFGDDGMKRIRDSFVVVVGMGGVGSAAATMLVRSGVRKIRLIDFDQVSLSSLNRHSTATLDQVGTPKVLSAASYYESVAPWVEVDPRVELFDIDQADELLSGNPDYVVDCIDNIDAKVLLLEYCHKRKIKVFCAVGAAAKSDPSRIQITDISSTQEDPLARAVRRRLRLKGVNSGIATVYSTEMPRKDLALLPLPEEEFAKGNVDELSALSNFRVRILPVLGPLPAMFGNAAAAYILEEIAGFKMETIARKYNSKMAERLHKNLCDVEANRLGKGQSAFKIPVSQADVLYSFEEINRGRSVVPPFNAATNPMVLKWKEEDGFDWSNLVTFHYDEGEKHIQRCLVGKEDPEVVWGPEAAALVKRRAEEERRLRDYRLV